MNNVRLWKQTIKGDYMKQKKYYEARIQINEHLSIEVDRDHPDHLLLFWNNQIHSIFALNRKTYTLFKKIQDLIHSPHYLTIEGNKGDLYAGEIMLTDAISMQVTNTHGCLTLDFFQEDEAGIKKLVYLTPLTYTTKTLFQNMLIPYRLKEDSNYRYQNVFKFLDMIEILNYEEKQTT
jgi:hypothetical protein